MITEYKNHTIETVQDHLYTNEVEFMVYPTDQGVQHDYDYEDGYHYCGNCEWFGSLEEAEQAIDTINNMKKRIRTFTLPSFWAGVLVNNDFTGMTDKEIRQFNEWFERVKPGMCAGVQGDSEPYFSHRNDGTGAEGGDVLDFDFYKPMLCYEDALTTLKK